MRKSIVIRVNTIVNVARHHSSVARARMASKAQPTEDALTKEELEGTAKRGGIPAAKNACITGFHHIPQHTLAKVL